MTGGTRGAVGRRTTSVLAVMVLLAVAVACSNNKSSVAGSGGTTPTSGARGPFANLTKIGAPNPCQLDPGVTASTITVGGVAPETGPSAQSFKPAEDGIKARFAMANQNHEVGSRTLVFKPVDDASDPTKNAEAARQLVEQDNVYGIVEVSDKAAGSATYLNSKGIPVTGWHVGVPAWATNANMFSFRSAASATPHTEATNRSVTLVVKLGGTKLALVAGVNQSSVDFVTRIEKSATPGSGVQVVYKTTDVTIGSTAFTSVVQRIKESGADSLITGLDFLQNTALSDQLVKAGIHLKVIVFPGGYDPRVLHLPGIEGATFGLEFIPFEQQIKDATQSYKDFDTYLPKDVVRNQVTYIGWLSANLFVEGLKQAGVDCPTRRAFIANLRLETGYTANGAFDPVDFISNFGHEFKCVYYVTVQNAQFVPLNGGKAFCGDLVKI
jgi:ABC-type branched-subunit amino acid transport system substrate-binding protein